MTSSLPPPTLLSIIICERVIIDRQGGSPSLIQITPVINAYKFPARHNLLTLFFELTNGRGKVNLYAELVDVENNDQALISGNGMVQFNSVHQVVVTALGFEGIVFPQAGEYRFNLYTQEERDLLGSRKIILRQLTMPQDLSGGHGNEF